MMRDKLTTYSLRLIILLLAFSLFSCRTQNLFEANRNYSPVSVLQSDSSFCNYKISVDDKVSVSIWGNDEMSIGSLFGIYNSNEVYGKWVMVDSKGQIMLPKIGRVSIEHLTEREAADTLTRYYSKYLVEPIIVVKVLNKEVSVLGEVNNPGTLLLEKEKNTLMEALSKSGGLTFYANKKKATIRRGDSLMTFDLTKIQSGAPILIYPNDVIYIPCRGGKVIDKKAPTLIPFTSVATAIAILVSLINR